MATRIQPRQLQFNSKSQGLRGVFLMEPDEQEDRFPRCLSWGNAPCASSVWASLFHKDAEQGLRDHFPGLQGPVLTPPVSLKVSAGRHLSPPACLFHQEGGGTLSCLYLEQRLGQDGSGQGP